MVHTIKGFGIVNKAEVDTFLELSCFLHDPEDVGNLISGSSAFSKTGLSLTQFFFFSLSLELMITQQTTQFKLCTKDCVHQDFPGGSKGKAFACNARDPCLIPGLGRSPGEGTDHPLQCSCLENPMDE